jgi:hypothetical protein
VTERVVKGVVTHIRGDHPTAPTKVEVHIKPEGGGEEIRVQPEHIIAIVPEITNTTEQAREQPLHAFAGAVDDRLRGRPQGAFIEDMEAQGQRELTSQTTKLPAEGSTNPVWKKMGVIFGPLVAGDAVFREVKLPQGWGWKAADADTNTMWNYLVDERGRVRGKMFYKAAFYDRRATIHPVTRYQCDRESKIKDDYDCPFREVVKDTATGAVLFMTDWVERPVKYTPEDLAREGAARKQTAAWLDANRPEWKDASAYWGWD